jgi:hypothetical protein
MRRPSRTGARPRQGGSCGGEDERYPENATRMGRPPTVHEDDPAYPSNHPESRNPGVNTDDGNEDRGSDCDLQRDGNRTCEDVDPRHGRRGSCSNVGVLLRCDAAVQRVKPGRLVPYVCRCGRSSYFPGLSVLRRRHGRHASIAEAVRVSGLPCGFAHDLPKPAKWPREESNLRTRIRSRRGEVR